MRSKRVTELARPSVVSDAGRMVSIGIRAIMSKSGARFALLIATLLHVSSAQATAQSVRGSVTDLGARPVSGAVVSLLDSTSKNVARALTSENGEFRLLAPYPGRFRLRTARIGFQPTLSAPITLSPGEVRDVPVRVAFLPVGLDTVRVASRSSCRVTARDSVGAAFTLWDQARTAIAATQLTTASRAVTATTMTYERTLDRGSRRVRAQTAAVRTDHVTQPWRAVSIDSLRVAGYVETNSNEESTYYAPDLDVLLSNAFLEDHCLKLVVGTDTTEIGAAFEPVPERNRFAEIAGTMWVDRKTSTLRRLDFRYVHLNPARMEDAGGLMQFAPMTNGSWAVVRWEVRMPVTYRPTPRSPLRALELRANGGELVVARRGADTLWRRPSLALSGVVTDSLSGAAVPAARVRLLGVSGQSTTDGRGRFMLPDVLPGQYTVNVSTPSLDSIGTIYQTAVSFTDSITALKIALPSVSHIAAAVCGVGNVASSSERGALFGTVRVLADTSPAARVRIAVEWTQQQIVGGRLQSTPRRIETASDGTGNWRLCGVPTEQLLSVRALPAFGRSQAVSLRLAADARFASAELIVDPSGVPVATLQGVVVSADSASQPLLDAEVLLPGLSLSTRTDSRGGFRIDDIPVGTHQLIVRRLGYGALDTKLSFEANEREERRVLLSRVSVLDSVDVRADFAIPSFEEHRRVGLGKFLTRAELSQMENRTVMAILSNFSGTQINSNKFGSYFLARARGPQSLSGAELRGGSAEDPAPLGCYAHVYLDNHPMYTGKAGQSLFNLKQLSPDRIEAIEYYASAAQTPARYNILNSTCGVLVIWTRRTYPDP